MKGKRTDLAGDACAIAQALGVVGDWWSLLIIRDAFRGRRRFGEFHQSIGLARNILSSRLKKLVEHGVLRVDEGSGSERLYVLTPKGEALSGVLVALRAWGETHCASEERSATAGDASAERATAA